MNLYVWASVALQEYYKGHIIVMAETVEGARKAARERYEWTLKKPYADSKWSWLIDDDGNFIDDDSKNEYLEKMAIFEDDIKVAPALIEDGILFINGSE